MVTIRVVFVLAFHFLRLLGICLCHHHHEEEKQTYSQARYGLSHLILKEYCFSDCGYGFLCPLHPSFIERFWKVGCSGCVASNLAWAFTLVFYVEFSLDFTLIPIGAFITCPLSKIQKSNLKFLINLYNIKTDPSIFQKLLTLSTSF